MNFFKGLLTQKSTQDNKVSTGAVAKGLLAAAVLTGAAAIAPEVLSRAAWAQAMLQQQGTLAPMEDAYTFEGETGQVMTIELTSEEFDTMLVLKGPSGEVLTSNDDYGGTLNSTIVLELPESGEYSAIASSFGGEGGSYQIEVRPASEYEQVFSRAYDLSLSEDFEESIQTYTAAIELNDTDPAAYLGRAEALIGQAYLNAVTTGNDSPDNLPKEIVDEVVADFLKAADLLEQEGQSEPAASLREQAQYFLGEPPAPQSDSPAEAETDAPTVEPIPDPMSEPIAPMPVEPMPVEPDGGVGDGATPIPGTPEAETEE